MRALGYTRVSTTEQAESGLGLAAQHERIISECLRRRWDLLQVFQDAGTSGKTIKGRPQLEASLKMLKAHEADVLVVSKLDRLSRSLLDFAQLMEQARKQAWALVILDLGVDTSSPSGAMLANIMASFAEYERNLIAQRTKDALAAKKAEGARLGRPSGLPHELIEKILELRETGKSLREIATILNTEAVPTSRGGSLWHPSSVRAVLLANG